MGEALLVRKGGGVKVTVDGVEVDKGMNLKTKITNICISSLPYTMNLGMFVVWHGELHMLGGQTGTYKQHYKWDGNAWTEVSTLPFQFYQGSAVVYEDEIHILGSVAGSSYYKRHCKWDGNTWTEVSTLPESGGVYNKAVVYNGSIYWFRDEKVYKWDGNTWTLLKNAGSGFYFYSPTVFDNEIYGIGRNSKLLKWNNSTLAFETITSAAAAITSYSSLMAVKNNEIYLTQESTGLQLLYKWDGEINGNFVQVGELPIAQAKFLITFKGELYLLGTSESYYAMKQDHWEIARKIYMEA